MKFWPKMQIFLKNREMFAEKWDFGQKLKLLSKIGKICAENGILVKNPKLCQTWTFWQKYIFDQKSNFWPTNVKKWNFKPWLIEWVLYDGHSFEGR